MEPLPGRRWPALAGGHEDELVQVHRCEQAEALVLKSLLESEGIPTLLRSHFVASLHPFSVGDQGHIAVLVPASEVSRCRPLMIRVLKTWRA